MPARLHAPRGTVGLYHLAWQVDTIEDLEQARMTLAELNAYTGESSHGATKSVYGVDRDGNEFEIMWMLPRDALGRVRERRSRRASGPAAGVSRWVDARTAGTIIEEVVSR